jgi:hypothetical protein
MLELLEVHTPVGIERGGNRRKNAVQEHALFYCKSEYSLLLFRMALCMQLLQCLHVHFSALQRSNTFGGGAGCR